MDNQNRSTVLQWLVPTVIMMIVVVAMLINFSSKRSNEAESTVSRNLITATETFAETFLHQLEMAQKTAKPICVLLEREGVEDTERTAELLAIARECSDSYEAVYCDVNGQGWNQDGAEISIADAAYFEALQRPESMYIYTEEEQPAVLVVERIATENLQGYLLLYYSMEHFDIILSKAGFDSAAFLAIVDTEGKILGVNGAAESNCLQSGNLLESVEVYNSETAKTMRNRMSSGSKGTFSIAAGKQKHTLVYVPLGAEHWGMVLGVSQDYVDRQVDFQWKSARNMITSLFIVIIAFVCIVMAINIVGKIRSNEKKRELEDKADTDLLTGLNNKLATERKIKTYMAQNPQSQSMLFLFDIDNFKKINDTMGHAFGDEVLRSLGTQIGAIFRASDIVGRVGGDEFMVFLKGITDEEIILKEARKVENFFKSFQAGEYVKYAATASIGVAIFPQEGADFESLYKAADQGLYKAKKRGKNQLAFYSDARTTAKQETNQA